MTKYVNNKTIVIAILAVGTISAILVTAALTLRSVNAFGAKHWMNDEARASGLWHSGYGGAYEANWTGSVPLNSVRADAIESIKAKVNVTVGETESIAKQELGAGSEVCCVTLAPVNGYLVYVVHGIDGSNNLHKVIVDAGNGNVLDSTKIVMEGFGPWKTHGYGGGMWR